LHFKPIFDSPLKKVVRGPPPSVGGALVRLGDSLARVKIWGPRFNIEISKVTEPNFTGLVSPNAGGIVVDGTKI